MHNNTIINMFISYQYNLPNENKYKYENLLLKRHELDLFYVGYHAIPKSPFSMKEKK